MKILLIEDEIKLANAIKHLFYQQKIECETANDGKIGYETALNGDFDVIILDVMLPSMNGYDILMLLRQNGINTPIIMLTAKSQLGDKVYGLNCGADDYLSKPFDAEELIARVKALSRRKGVVVMDTLKFEDLTLNLNTYELSSKTDSIKLNFKEKEIMQIFLLSPNITITRDILFEKVWGYDSETTENSMEAYISFLRKKLKFLGTKLTIKNYQKIGYRLEENK